MPINELNNSQKGVGNFLYLADRLVFVPKDHGFEISTNPAACNAFLSNVGLLVIVRSVRRGERICVHWPLHCNEFVTGAWKLILAFRAVQFLFELEEDLRCIMDSTGISTAALCV